MDAVTPILATVAAHLAAKVARHTYAKRLRAWRRKAAIHASMLVGSLAATLAVQFGLDWLGLAPPLSRANSLELLTIGAEALALAAIAGGLWSDGKAKAMAKSLPES